MSRLGEAEEQLVRQYHASPTQELRDQIVAFCGRFVKSSFKKYLKTVLDYEEYSQGAHIKIIEALNKYDPSRGSFINWAMNSSDNYAKALRFRTKRHKRVHRLCGSTPSERVAARAAKATEGANARWNQASRTFETHDEGAIPRIVRSIRAPFVEDRMIYVCQWVYHHFLRQGAIPKPALLIGAGFLKLFSMEDLRVAYVRAVALLRVECLEVA